MRDTVRVPVTRACNMRCEGCRIVSAEKDPELAPEKILQRLREYDFSGVRRVVFTGGEPTLVPRLPEFILLARERGAADVQIETNGMMFAYEKYARRIKRAGATTVTVAFRHVEREAADAITGAPGGYELALKGLKNCVAEELSGGMRLILTPRLVRDRGLIEKFLDAHVEGLREIELAAPPAGDDTDFAAIGETLHALARRSKRSGIPCAFFPLKSLPPCLFERANEISEVFFLEADATLPARSWDDDCPPCVISNFCPGLPDENRRFCKEYSRPITWDSPWAAFRVGTGAGGEPFTGFCSYTMVGGEEGAPEVHEALLRISYGCNEACRFCWIEPRYENPTHEEVVATIRELAGMDIGLLSLTGGEPALNPRLADYVSFAAGLGIKRINLQTNGTLLGGGLAARLKGAGLGEAFVSLHAHEAALSDSITGAPGAFDKTLRGISALMDAGVRVSLSFVTNALNHRVIPDYVRFVAERFPGVTIVFSFVAPIYSALMHRGLVPRYSDVRDHLRRGLDLCLELGVPFSGMSMACGVPPCIMDGDRRYYHDLRRVPPPEPGANLAKSPRCEKCSLNDYCFGFRQFYVELYGDEEMRPVECG